MKGLHRQVAKFEFVKKPQCLSFEDIQVYFKRYSRVFMDIIFLITFFLEIFPCGETYSFNKKNMRSKKIWDFDKNSVFFNNVKGVILKTWKNQEFYKTLEIV